MNNANQTIEDAINAKQARDEQGAWIPAGGGSEKSFRHGDYTYQYMYQPSTHRHAYLCLDTDLFLSNDQADKVFA